MSDGKRPFFLNPGQRYLFEVMPRKLDLIAARRFGKTDGTAAPALVRVIQMMPRGKSAIYCSTLKQGLTRTIPGTIAAIERITGLSHGIHFFVGCHAPKAAGFPEPYVRPYNWEHCIHWWNGHVSHILSQDVKFSANSLTLDFYLIDEARNIRKQKVDEELEPALSGTPGHFDDCPLKKGAYIITDRPITREGQWVLDRKSLSTPDIERKILECIQNYAYMKTHGWSNTYIRKELEELNNLRRDCHLFKEYDTIENAAIVGEDYIADMKRILPPKIFAISILNIPQRKASDGFYSAFDESLHTYVVEDADLMENFRTVLKPASDNRIRSSFETYDFKRLQEHSCIMDSEIDPKQPLNIALDYNENINWIVTAQEGNQDGMRTMDVLSSMFVKNERKLRELSQDWCDYYEPQRLANNKVNFYYNQTAKQKGYANNLVGEAFHVTVTKELQSRGWQVNTIDMGEAVGHMTKFFMWDDAFKKVVDPLTGKQKYLFPRLNRYNNEFLICAIENTDTIKSYGGFSKDKSGEKLKDSEEDPSELRTDGTDALDDLFIGMNRFKRASFRGVPVISC